MKHLIFALFMTCAHAADLRYEGTVDLSNCSGFVFQFEGAPTTQKALIMTNGHCMKGSFFGGMAVDPGEATGNKSESRDVKIITSRNTVFKTTTRRLVYGTMTISDMAIYELSQTYGDLIERGIRPFTISTTDAAVGDSVVVISAHKDNINTCQVEHITPGLKEGGYSFVNSLRFSSECRQSNGTSGSPVILAGTRTVIAINNSYNKDGKRCSDNNPCEVFNGVTNVFKGARYGQQISLLTNCVDEKFALNFSLPGCALIRP